MHPTKFRFSWPSSFRGEHLKKSANQKQELPVAAMFVNGSGQHEHSLWIFIDYRYNVQIVLFLAHLAKGRQGELLPSPSSVSFSHFNRLL
jgi:hypothetical protein